MKGIIQYERIGEEKVKKLLTNYGLKHIRTLKFLNYIVFNYKPGEEFNAVVMAMKVGKLSGLTLENKINRITEPEVEN